MIDPRDWKPEKLQCVHHNDAENCYACGTGRVSKGPNAVFDATGADSFSPTGGYIPPIPQMCPQHDMPTPCLQCELEDWRDAELEKNRRAEVARINELSNRIWAGLDAGKYAQAWPAGGKCVHGVYLSQFYCGVCAIEIVEPGYDRNRFRYEITEALKAARTNFHAGGYYAGKDKKERLTEGEKNFQDLLGLVDLEVWKASRHYGEKMNGALAATIAKNTAGKFTAEVIEDQTVVRNIEWAAMPSDYRERAFALFTKVGSIEGLVRLSKDDRSPKSSRELAKSIIHDYGIRAPRFESMDVPTEFGDGEDRVKDGDSTSEAEYAVHEGERREEERASEMGEIFDAHREGLELLVKTWRGDLRKVGEAMLTGTFNTRGVRGVSRNSASRLYQKAVQAFRAYIGRNGK